MKGIKYDLATANFYLVGYLLNRVYTLRFIRENEAFKDIILVTIVGAF